MKSLSKLVSLANRFTKYSQSAEGLDIENALKAGGAFNLSNEVAPLLNAAQVPEDAAVSIKIVVKPGPRFSFPVTVTRTDDNGKVVAVTTAAQKLSALLNNNKSIQSLLANALKNNLTKELVEQQVNWLTF